MEIFLRIVIILSLAYVGVCVIYFLFQENFIFVPTFPSDSFESRLSTSTQEFFLNTPLGGRIHSILLTVDKPRGLVFYLHGNTGSLKRWQFMAEEVSGYGFDVFVMDLCLNSQKHKMDITFGSLKNDKPN